MVWFGMVWREGVVGGREEPLSLGLVDVEREGIMEA